MLSDSIVNVFDWFMREDSSLDRNYPAIVGITRPDVFTVQVCVCVSDIFTVNFVCIDGRIG